MLKKLLILAGIILFSCACVITSPAEMFSSTPTMCVECMQATICAENQSGEACPLNEEPTTAVELPTLIPTETEEPDSTATATETPIYTETPEPLVPDDVTEEASSDSTDTFTVETEIEQPAVTSTGVLINTPVSAATTVAPFAALTSEPLDLWLYKKQNGSPKYIKNFTHSEAPCGWGGIAGQVFGPGNVPQSDVVVVVTGIMDGKEIDLVGLTGTAKKYGEGGYEIEFPDGPVTTTNSLAIQLFDENNNELSDIIPINTYAECSKNLMIFNFVLAK